jgi:hypothetical protein
VKRTVTFALAALILTFIFSAFPHRGAAGPRSTSAAPVHMTRKADSSSPNLYLIASAILTVLVGWRRISRRAGVKTPSL